jgi:hypothetical protein
LLLNGRVRAWRLLRNDFSEYTGPEKDERHRKINPLLRNVYKQNAYFRGNEYIDKPLLKKRNRNSIVEFPQQRDTLTNTASKIKRTLRQGVLYPARKIHLRGVDFGNQELLSQLSAFRQREETSRYTARETQNRQS